MRRQARTVSPMGFSVITSQPLEAASAQIV